MAQITQDTKLLSDSTGQEVKEQVLESEGGGVVVAEAQNLDKRSSSTPSVAVTDPHTEKTSSNSTNTQSNEPPSRPSLVPLGSANVQSSSITPVAPHPERFNAANINKKFLEKNTASGSATTASASSTTKSGSPSSEFPSSITPVAPHPKRFNAVNINKKFLEKNTASGSATTASASSTTKSGSPSTRPSVQPTSSHSRLVTAKLTATPAVGSSTAGWSRPSSVAPSPATNSPSSTSPLPTAAVAQPSTTAAPQLPHAGKVILPQPRSSVPQSSSQKDGGSNKPVWGTVKPPSVRPDIEPSDFPTAAEVANVASTTRKQTRVAEESKATSETAAKQLRSEEADAFRGVHLDPNVHHWDEMEEDDDNFLGGVIEFGDGRQYKIESTESNHPGAPLRPQEEESHLKESAIPVSKEERFVDDFDRSWPKSRNSPASASKDVASTTYGSSPNVSPVISNATHSPQDSSRVLFNERSNRLEPYSQAHRQQPPFGSKRSHYQEGSGPLSEPRTGKDGSQNIQVLQKPPVSDFGSRGRRFSGSGGNISSGHPNGYVGDRNREREPLRRDGPPPSPRLPRDQDTSSRESNQDRGRKVPMGPPPVPSHAGQRPQDGGRQLPPHLSQRSPNIPQRRLPSRDSRFSPSDATIALPGSTLGRIPPQSPATSHASLTLVSPVVPPAAAVPLGTPDMDEARKGLMHTAAERAKQRRQQEEEEREAQKERARRKAAEIEEKMKAANAEKERVEQEAARAAAKEKEVVNLIEEAVKIAETSGKPSAEPAPPRLALQRPPSLKAITRPVATDPRPGTARRLSTTTAPLTPLSATQPDSWRRSNHVPQSPLPRQIQPRPSASATFIPSGPSAAEQVETIADESKDDLEIVDFSDMGKFVGAPDVPDKSKEDNNAESATIKHPRPVASDFFDEPTVSSIPSSKKAEFGAWRKKVSQDSSDSPLQKPEENKPDNEIKRVDASPSGPNRVSPIKDHAPSRDVSFSPDVSAPSTKEPLLHLDGGQTVHVPHSPGVQRTPRSQTFYKEATMSSIEDAMSRIKGVLVTMKTHESPKEVSPSGSGDQEAQPRANVPSHPPSTPVHPPHKERWVPPALRPRKFDDTEDHEPREIFLVTMLQPPPSPSLPNGKVAVRLPSISHRREIIHKKQLNAFSRAAFQARMDILSFDPPVYDMNRRDLSLNDVLFRKPPYSKGRLLYRVSLPRRPGPKVNIPTPQPKLNGTGAFGRPTVADGATTWRKAVLPLSPKVDLVKEETGLATTSRSPPPDSTPPEIHVASIPKSNDNSPTKSESGTAVKSRTQPKMPAGLAVAFRRDSRIFEAEAAPVVNFIVGSQLDEDLSPQIPPNTTRPSVEDKGEAVALAINGISKSLSTSAGERVPIISPPKAESTDVSSDRVLVTPPSHSTSSWSRSSLSLPIKDSPARAPDPEHLKAVWSQTSNKPGLHSVNSLEGIADDLTALPFTLQDVKSEDGETPPPSLPSAPSRMSLHEVTRAFQTVPTSSSASNQPPHRAAFSPPSTHAPVARPTTGTYAYSPAVQNNMRPAYVSYPSPMISHSPAPVMYGPPMGSNPVPNRMHTNGHTPLYSQSMWMTMPPPSSQPHGNMMRPVVSPYPAQMMAYPSPGYGPQPPPPNMIPGPQQPQNAGRGRGMPMISPVMSHAHAHPGANMYGGSPVMMHAVQVPQNLGYMPIQPGRGQPRADNGSQQQPQQHTTHNQPQPPHNGFNPAPTQPFVRPTW